MSLMSPVSCLSEDFSLYRISFFWFYCNCYQLKNQIHSMMSLTIMGLSPDSLVHALFLFLFEESVVSVDHSVGRVDNSVRRVNNSVCCVYDVGSGVF